jgi:hypothetical protein
MTGARAALDVAARHGRAGAILATMRNMGEACTAGIAP